MLASNINVGGRAIDLKFEDLDLKNKILRMLSRPEHCEVIRYNDGVAAKKTVVAKPFRRFEINSTDAPAEQAFFLFRSGPVNVISPINRTQNFTYEAYCVNIPGYGGLPTISFAVQFTAQDLEHSIDPSYWKVSSGSASQPHGDYFLCGKSKTANSATRFIWIDAGCNLVFAGTTSAASTLGIILDGVTSNKFRPNVQQSTQIVGAPGAFNVTFPVTNSGYFAIRATSSAPASLTNVGLSINQGTSTTVSRHICMKNYCDNISDWLNMRMLSSSIRYCNTAPVLNLSGSVAMANIPAGQMWSGYTSFGVVSSLAEAYNDDVREGAFARLSIAKNEDMTMWDWTGIDSNNNLLDTFWDIEPTSPFVAMNIAIADTAGRIGFIEQWSAIEFETTKTQYEPDTPLEGSLEPWSWAIQHLKDVPQFTKNKIHLEEIGAAIKKALAKTATGLGRAAKFTAKYAPKVLDTLHTGQEIATYLAAL